MKDQIQKAIAEAIPELGLKPEDVLLEHPTDIKLGDFSSNVAMVKAKEQKINPRELAEKIKAALDGKIEGVERIEVAGPGFINFFLASGYFNEEIGEALNKQEFGKNESQRNKEVIIEYTNTNVLKPMHIGHLMGNVIGESLSRIFEWSGAEVKRDTYEGDVGLHIAKAVWGIRKLGGMIGGDLHDQSEYVGRAYAEGATAYEDDESAKKEIEEMNKKIFDKDPGELQDMYQWGRKLSLSHFEELYKKLGTAFDYYFFESEVADEALSLVEAYEAKGLFEKSDGAVVFKGEKYDPKLHTRVFVTKQGLPTYEAKDVAHAIRKYGIYPADASIIITANEQDEYFKVVLRALREIKPEIAGTTTHISHGMLKLPTGKMSSRTGNIITGESLIVAMQELVFDKMKDRELTNEEKNIVSEQVGVAAIKYSILKQAPGKDIIYDFDKSLSFEGDSGPYLQYATVRAQSVLEKAKKEGIASSLQHPDETVPLVAKLLARFPEIVLHAQENLAPNYIVTYLIELSSSFNGFYADNKIVDTNDVYSPYRVALTEAFVKVMQSGLYLLGMKVPEKM